MNLKTPPLSPDNKMLLKTPSPVRKKKLKIPKPPSRSRSLQIKQERAQDINNFIFDIKKFDMIRDNNKLKFLIRLSLFIKDLNFINEIKEIKNIKLTNLDEIVFDYKEDSYFKLKIYENDNDFNIFELRYIDYNDFNNLKLIYKKFN